LDTQKDLWLFMMTHKSFSESPQGRSKQHFRQSKAILSK